MYISTNWLKNFIKIEKTNEKSPTEVTELEKILSYSQFPTELLTLTGFEVEGITQETYKNEEDIIIEIDTTPNRSDVNNMVGFSREISSLMNFPLSKKSFFDEKPRKQCGGAFGLLCSWDARAGLLARFRGTRGSALGGRATGGLSGDV